MPICHAPEKTASKPVATGSSPEQATERCRPGTVVDGRYRVLGRIGSGGTAAVYRAEDLRLRRDVALKVLHPCLAEDDECLRRFQREAISAAAIRHEHIVAVYDRGTWGGTDYIAMEYVDGRSLRSIVRERAPFAHRSAIDITVQLLDAVACIHRHGLIHRDLKPDNAIVDRHGRLKVTDFGIARTRVSDLTLAGSILGSVRYVSPEQAQGRALTAAADLYSVGVILYELLTGRVPFEGESVIAVTLKHVNERPTPPSIFNATTSPELEAIVMRALEKDPARRFPDADAFINALMRVPVCSHAAARPARTHATAAARRSKGLAPTKRWELLRRTQLAFDHA